MPLPDVGIIVLTWNNYDYTRECLESLFRAEYPSRVVYVVDNASTDGSIPKLIDEFPKCHFIINKDNYGYAGGNNMGIQEAIRRGSRYIWIVNNDVVVDEHALIRMVTCAERDNSIGIVGSKVCFFDRPHDTESIGGKLNRVTGSQVLINEDKGGVGKTNLAEEVDFVSGCSMLLRSECIERVGMFDESFFLYCEEVDLAIRARKGGWRVVCSPDAVVWHRSAASQDKGRVAQSYYLARNTLYLMHKHYRLQFPLTFVLSTRYHIINHLLRRRWAHLRASFRGYLDFFAGKMGRGWA